MVERDLAKVDVAGSTPVSRSRNSSGTTCRFAARIHPGILGEKGVVMGRKALWFVVGLTLLGTMGCGNSGLSSVSLSPAVADAQNFPNGKVQFTAMGIYGGSSKPVPASNLTWCVGTSTGACFGNIAAPASVDGNGLAQCHNLAPGTVTIIAGTGGQPMPMPDGGQQLKVYGTAQLTCP